MPLLKIDITTHCTISTKHMPRCLLDSKPSLDSKLSLDSNSKPSFLFEVAGYCANQVCETRMEKELFFIMKIRISLPVWKNKLSHELLHLIGSLFEIQFLDLWTLGSATQFCPSVRLTPFCQDWVITVFMIFCMKFRIQ